MTDNKVASHNRQAQTAQGRPLGERKYHIRRWRRSALRVARPDALCTGTVLAPSAIPERRMAARKVSGTEMFWKTKEFGPACRKTTFPSREGVSGHCAIRIRFRCVLALIFSSSESWGA
jgi:hypothetical protein